MFDEAFPYYLAMGMPAAEYWDGESWLVKGYRRAQEIRLEQENHRLWLQGMYFYEGISVALAKAFSKSAHNIQYSDKPYDLGITKKKQTKAQQNEEKTQNTVSFLHRLTNRFNEQFARKKEQEVEKMLAGEAGAESKENK